MSTVEGTTRASFFTNTAIKKSVQSNYQAKALLKGNDLERQKEIDKNTERDADVKISDAIKDFAKIKKTVDMAKPIDNSEKIAHLKAAIESGTYKMDYEAIADKIINSEL